MRVTYGEVLLDEVREQMELAVGGAPSAPLKDVMRVTSGYNPQTTQDLEVDAHLAQRLGFVFPDMPILSEENVGAHAATKSAKQGGELAVAERRLVVDPVDGSANPWAGHLLYAISAALQRQGRSEVAAVAVRYLGKGDSELQDVYSAVRGMGAYKNGMPFRNSLRVPEDHPAYKITAFGIPGRHAADRMYVAFKNLYRSGWHTRQSGSACVDICNVATGVWSAFFEYGLKLWDIAGSILIAQEAGCVERVIPTREPYTYDVIVARNQEVLDQIAAMTGIGAPTAEQTA